MRQDGIERVLDPGLRKVMIGASSSPNPASKHVLAGYERFLDLQESSSQVEELERGDIPIGIVLPSKNKIFRLRSSEMSMHTAVVSSSGGGKTLLASNLAVEASKLDNTCVWVFDKKGNEYSWLARHHGFKLFPITLLRRNPFEPVPGMPWEHRAETFPELFMSILQMGEMSKGFFTLVLRHAKERYREKLSFWEFREAVEQVQPRSYKERIRIDYCQKIIARTDMVLASELRNVVSCYRSMPIENLLRENIVWSCTGTSTLVQNFLISSLLMDAVHWRHYNKVQNPLLITILEEAENIAGRSVAMPTQAISPVEKLFREARSANLALVVANQTYTSLNPSVRSDSFTRILLPQSDSRELISMAQSMGLSQEEIEIAKGMRVGEAVVRSGRHPDPFFIQIPEFKIDRNVNYQETLQESQPFIESLPYTPVDESYKAKIQQLILGGKPAFKTMSEIRGEADDLGQERLNEYLFSIASEPKLNLNERAGRLSFGKGKQTVVHIKGRILELGLAREVLIKEKLRGAPGLYLELTNRGKEHLIRNKLVAANFAFNEGKGGLIHSAYQTIIKESVESKDSGLYAVVEAGENRGYSCDVGVYKKGTNEKACAYEVSVSTDKEEDGNITRDLKQGWPKVVLVAVSATVQDGVLKEVEEASRRKAEKFEKRLKEKFSKEILEQIRVTTIREFLQ